MDTRFQDGIEVIHTASATGAGVSYLTAGINEKTVQVKGNTTSGTGAATVKIQVSNDGTNWLDAGTVTLTLGTAVTSDGFAFSAPWVYTRANVTTITGTGSSVTVTMGV